MALADDLRAAKALINTPEKWSKGQPVTTRGGFCAWVAVCVSADTVGHSRMESYDALIRALPLWWRIRAALSRFVRDAWIIRFNDDPHTTHADIMALFDRAIAAAEGGRND